MEQHIKDFNNTCKDGILLTKEDIIGNDATSVTAIENKLGTKKDLDEKLYKNLVIYFFASVRCSKSKGIITLVPFNQDEEVKKKLIGSGAPAVGLGTEEPVTGKDKAAGSIANLLFWNDAQIQVLYSEVRRCMVTGFFGTGKTIMLVEKMRRELSRQMENGGGTRLLCVSCLEPSQTDSPPYIYNYLMKQLLDSIPVQPESKITFSSAEDVCREMDIPTYCVSKHTFYSKLPEYILKKTEEIQGKLFLLKTQKLHFIKYRNIEQYRK